MQRINTVPIQNSEESERIEDGRLTNGAPSLLRSVPDRLNRGWVVELAGVEIPGTGRSGVFRR